MPLQVHCEINDEGNKDWDGDSHGVEVVDPDIFHKTNVSRRLHSNGQKTFSTHPKYITEAKEG